MKTEYAINVIPLNERKAAIEHEKKSSPRTHRFYEFRSEINDLPVIRLAIGLPIYRTANYRTNILQLKWIREKKLATNFFSSGEENNSVQVIQHDFLWDLAQTEKESIKSIRDTLEQEQQREPILITCSGVVVNGNRRLAAMRELKMQYVDCMVLPETANEDDLKDIEVRLQMTPETRLPYGWINECIAIKDLQSRNRSVKTIADLMRMGPSKVTYKLQMLSEIDMYLKEWKGAEADYDQLNDAEEIIAQVTKRINEKQGVEQELARHLAWILLDNRGDDGNGRIYNLRDVTGTLTRKVVDKLEEIYSDEISSEVTSNASTELEFELEDQSTENSEQKVVSFLKTLKGNGQKQKDIVGICRVIVEIQKNEDAGNLAFDAVKDAHTKLIEVDLSTANSNTYAAIKKQLDGIEQRTQYLKSELTKYEAKGKKQ